MAYIPKKTKIMEELQKKTSGDTDAKKFYRNDYHLQHSKTFINCILYGFIAAQNPKTVFEFGANAGRHLRRLIDYLGVKAKGIDVSPDAVEAAKKMNNLDVELGDENYLVSVKEKYDIVLTVSVLCHILDIGEIVAQLKRIGKMVIIVETNTLEEKFYYKHDYVSLGFTPVISEPSPTNKCLYTLYYFKPDTK